MDTRAGSRVPRALALVVVVLALVALGALPAAPSGATSATAGAPVPALAFGAARAVIGADGLSPATPAATPFSLAGVALPAGARGALRVSLDGRVWSAWLPVQQEEPGPGEPVWTGAARWLQVRGPAGATVRVDLVDSLGMGRGPLERLADGVRGLAARAGAGGAAHAAPARPAIVSRAGWGADERLRRGAPRYADGVRALIVHHTAGGNGYRAEEGPAVVRAIYGYHTRVLGWDDIGYHLLVDRYGRIYEGRAGGVDRPVIGAHAGGFNQRTSGISVMGSFQVSAPPPAAYRALVDVLAWKAQAHGIDPRGSTELRSTGSTRYPAGARPRIATLAGHRDLSKTACPGQALYDQLPALREQVARRMGQPAPGLLPGGILDAVPLR